MHRRLGQTEIEVTPIGLGCWQFSGGSGIAGKFWEALPQRTVDEVVAVSLERGINWFDTAEMYGGGASERALSAALQAAGKGNRDVVVATKWSPFFRTAGSIGSTIGKRLACLSPFGIDLHQVHQPAGLSSVEAEMAAMADLMAEKKIHAVGVSNFNQERMRRAHAALAKRGIPLASNQVRYSLVDRRIEADGTLAAGEGAGRDDHRLFTPRPGAADREVPRRPDFREDAARSAEVDASVQAKGARAHPAADRGAEENSRGPRRHGGSGRTCLAMPVPRRP
jgi:aryl-alcohol dehydrogenase-like predicted oxidoreductase